MSTISLLHKLAIVKGKALGIPLYPAVSPVPEVGDPFTTKIAIQKHKSTKAGTHYDLRLDIDGVAYSWAIPKAKLPKPGEKLLAAQTFDHDVDYMRYQGNIGPGYGEGKVDLEYYGDTDVLECTPKKIKFNLYRTGTEVEQYNLVKTRGDNWLLLNSTKTRQNNPEIPNYKPDYKEKSINDADPSVPGELWSVKIDGANTVVSVNPGKQVEVFSYRESKNNPSGLINHTYKIPRLVGLKAPKNVPPAILRGEVYGVDPQTGEAILAKDVGAILNSSTFKARDKQKDLADLRLALFDVFSANGEYMEDKPYKDKLEFLETLCSMVPELELPYYAVEKNDKARLADDMKAGKIKESKEGIVAWKLDSGGSRDATKLKVKKDYDVVIEDMFHEKGDRPLAGGFFYSLLGKPGEITGKVGTGFSHVEKEDILKNFEKNWKGRVAKLKADDQYSSGALRAPSFVSLHPDYPEAIKE